ncbi:MAG: NAD-dependent epimerase/dehydratase family protein [Thermoleophilia bacterium]
MKKVGVTGVAGFVGANLADRLLADGYEVIGVDDLSTGSLDNLDLALPHPSFRFIQMDCSDADALMTAFDGVDGIIHLAAKKIPRYSGALATLEENVAGMHAATKVALAFDADLVVASTSDVYGNAPLPFVEDGPIVLGPPTTRRWAYAVSKLYDEHIGLALAEEKGLKITILRLFGSYGPRNHPSWWGGPQAAFIETLLDGGTIDIHSDGMQIRSFTFVTDTVDGFVRALERPQARGHVINLGGDTPSTIVSLAELVHEALGIEEFRAQFIPYSALPGNYQDVRERVPDMTKVRELLEFQPQVDLREGLRRTVEWHLARRERLKAAGS